MALSVCAESQVAGFAFLGPSARLMSAIPQSEHVIAIYLAEGVGARGEAGPPHSNPNGTVTRAAWVWACACESYAMVTRVARARVLMLDFMTSPPREAVFDHRIH